MHVRQFTREPQFAWQNVQVNHLIAHSVRRKNQKMASDKPTRKELVAMVWKHCPSTYKGTELLVLVKLAGLTNTAKGYAYPSLYYLSLACGLVPTRGVQKIVARLKKAGALSIKKSAGGRNRYTLNVEHIRSLPLAVPPEVEEKEEPLPEESAAVAAEPVKSLEPVTQPERVKTMYSLQGLTAGSVEEFLKLLHDPNSGLMEQRNSKLVTTIGGKSSSLWVKVTKIGDKWGVFSEENGNPVTLPSGDVLKAA
jgi:hypothetical protein